MSDIGEFQIIQSKDINKFTRKLESSSLYMTDIRNPEKYFVKKDDILIQVRGEQYPPTLVNEELRFTAVSSQYYIIRIVNDMILPEYLSLFLEQHSVQNYLRSHSSGTTIKMIHQDVLANLSLNIPPIEIQKKIIELSKLVKKEAELSYTLINKRSRMLDALYKKVNSGEIK